MMRKALAIVALVLLAVWAAPALAATDGVLEGKLINGTAGGPPPGAGLAVTLHVMKGTDEVSSSQTTTDTQGQFRFSGLDTDPGLSYYPDAVYLGVSYRSTDGYTFSSGQLSLAATLTVYETTEDPSKISLQAVHIIAENLQQVLRISEVHLFGNSGDRTYIGKPGQAPDGQRTTVTVPLPEGAVGLAFLGDSPSTRYIQADGEVLDTEPVRPGSGSSAVEFSYHLLVDGTTVPLDRKLDYTAQTVSVLAVQPGLTVQSTQLQAQEPISFQGQDFQVYTGQDLGTTTPLSLEFVPLAVTPTPAAPSAPVSGEQGASPTAAQARQSLIGSIGLGVAGLALIGAVVVGAAWRPAVQRGRGQRTPPRNAAVRQLLGELAALDESFEAGQLEAANYERQRAEMVEKLKSAWK